MNNDFDKPVASLGNNPQENMDIVVVGHVDHGKSSIIGRLLADTGSLPEGKLEQVKKTCELNARPFEYAFLLDALKNEQAQGITIDTARCFFNTDKRHYIIHDAPGHIEFLKNMVTGASRAEAALLVIDAAEGIQENSKRHGYILSMLGIRQVVVLINKMDLVDYSEKIYCTIEREYRDFLSHLGVEPECFIPISAQSGVNITNHSSKIPWYNETTLLEKIDSLQKFSAPTDLPFRMPLQDVYKFTEENDDRRIFAGTIETGILNINDEVTFLPSGKKSKVRSFELFNAPACQSAGAGQVVGITLDTQVYAQAGELMVRTEQKQACTGKRFRANIFWMGRAPLLAGKRYKLKIGSARVPVELVEILTVLDASELNSVKGKKQIERHDVGECILEMTRPIAFDLSLEIAQTSRFVIVDNFEIAGCGIVLGQVESKISLLEEMVQQREVNWDMGYTTPAERQDRYQHSGKFVILAGSADDGTQELAKKLERHLFLTRTHTYYLSIANVIDRLGSTKDDWVLNWEEQIRRLGEMARIITDAGLVFITALDDIDKYDIDKLRLLNEPNEIFIVRVGGNVLRDFTPEVSLPANPDTTNAINEIAKALNTSGVLLDFCI